MSLLLNYFYRIKFFLKLVKKGSFIHPFFKGNAEYLSESALVDIGSQVYIGKDVWLSIEKSAKLKIGNNTHINKGFVMACNKQIEIGNNVVFADRVFVADSDHRYEDVNMPILLQGMSEGKAVKIEDDCWIGINACVLKGVTIGKHSVVGANSVVTKDVPAFSVVAGNPANIIKKYDFNKKMWLTIEKKGIKKRGETSISNK